MGFCRVCRGFYVFRFSPVCMGIRVVIELVWVSGCVLWFMEIHRANMHQKNDPLLG